MSVPVTNPSQLPDFGQGFAFAINPNSPTRDAVASFVEEYREKNVDPSLTSLPPLAGEDIVPHALTYSSIIGAVSKVYLLPDESIHGMAQDANLMRDDLGIMECIEIRQRMVAELDWEIVPPDKKHPGQAALADELTQILKSIRRFTEYRRSMQEAIWVGRHGIQHRYGNELVNGRYYKMPKAHIVDHPGWRPIQGDKIVFRFDDGSEFPPGAYPDQLGIRVRTSVHMEGRRTERQRAEPTTHGMAIFLRPYERETMLVHKHMIEDADFWDSRQAGRIHGVGIRSRIRKTWILKQETLGFLMRYLERSAGGIEIWNYPSGNPEAKAAVIDASQKRSANGRNIIYFPKPLGEDAALFDVQIVEPGFSGIDLLNSLQDKYFGHQIKRYILGQTLTTEADATGLGGNLAEIHKDTLVQIIRYDGDNHAETLSEELVRPIQKFNFPETLQWKMQVHLKYETEDSKEKLDGIRAAWEMGARISEQSVLDQIGAELPGPDDRTLVNPSLAGPGATGGASPFGSFPSGTTAVSAAVHRAMGEHSQNPGRDGDGDGFAGDGTSGQRWVGEPDSYARQLSLWNEDDHPREPGGDDKPNPKGGQFTAAKAGPAVGPAGITAQEAIAKFAGNGTSRLTHKNAVNATFAYTGTSPAEWSAVPVSSMKEISDGGKTVVAPVFDFPKGYEQIETPWSGDDCCHLCGTKIKNAFHIQHDGQKKTMLVGSECVTHFGEGDSGDKAAKKSIAAANRDFVSKLEESMLRLREIGMYDSVRHDHASKTSRTVKEWGFHLPKGREAKELYEQIRGTMRHSTGEDIRSGKLGKESTDRVIANWRKKKGKMAEELLQRSSELLDSEPDSYARRSERLIAEAVRDTHTNPSEAQIKAGNYSKGLFRWNGLEIAIENPKGSERRGFSDSGREWSRTMACHYGYFRRTKASDGDALDVYIGSHPDSDFVLVIKQVDQNGRFDEFKVVIGCLNRKQAKKLYLANYPKGWKCGPAASMTVGLFKKWVASGGPMKAKTVTADSF